MDVRPGTRVRPAAFFAPSVSDADRLNQHNERGVRICGPRFVLRRVQSSRPSGITVSSLDFGYPMNGFGTEPTTIENVSVVRSGGHFWGSQTFPGIWLFSASKVFQGIRINNVEIVDPTYSGIMFQTNYVGGQPQFPIKDTVLSDISISGARKSGDAYDAKSGFGLWANEMPEAGQGPRSVRSPSTA